MRNLTKTLAVVSFLLPASAYPLGIGEIKLHSALNQNLDAEIALVLSAGEKASDIKVALAPPDKFDETGIPWSYFLSKLKFQTIVTDGNRVVIKVASREALKEPFLDFLLQVSWPKGELFREFTVLVDPPAEYAHAATPLTQAAASYAQPPQQYRRQEQQPAVQQRPRKSRPKVTASGNGGRYGPVGRHDNLWKIAEGLSRETGTSVEQMMVALYEANPGAFYKANINALANGKTLTIPSREEVLKLSQADALDEFNRQMEAWRSPSSVPRVSASEIAEAEAASNQLTLSAPAQDSVGQNASVPPAGQTAGGADKGASGRPDTAAQGSADAAIAAKLDLLEKQIAAMQAQIALKDEQLAALQSRTKVPESPAPATTAPPAVVTPPTVTPANIPPVTPAEPKPVPAPAPVANVTPTPAPAAVPNKVAEPPKTAPVKPPVRRVAPVQEPEQSTPLWMYLGIGMLGLSALGLAAWFWLRRRQTDHQDLFDVVSISKRPKQDPTLFADDEQNISDSGDMSDNLFVSDFNSGEFDVFDMDQAEIDPISEADVYLAYGRYQQAEELMRHAIDEQPSRDEFKLKLLEIFYAHEDRAAFEKYTGELVNEGKIDEPAFWSKVTEMGSEICPDSMFFAGPETAVAESKKMAAVSDEQVFTQVADSKSDEMDFDLTSFEELFYSDEESNTANPLFDLDSDISKSLAPVKEPEPEEEAKANNDSLDFDFTALSFNVPAQDAVAKEPEAPAAENLADEFESFDFTPALSVKSPATETKVAEKTDTDDFSSLDFDFSSIETSIKGDNSGITFETLQPSRAESFEESYRTLEFSIDEPLVPEPPAKPVLFQDESLSINLDFNKPSLGISDQQRIESFGVANLSEMDEMETKLDLAMAYIDMGDNDAAMEIALEVLEKGTPEQQMIAKALLENYQ